MNNKTVQDYIHQLIKFGIEHQVLEHPQLISVAEVQKYLGFSMGDAAATLLMKADDRFVAIIRRGDTKLDSTKVKKYLGVTALRMANEEEFADITGVPSGAASVYIPNVPTYIDKKIFEKEYINAGSGSLLVTIRYKTADLKKLPGVNLVDFCDVVATHTVIASKDVKDKRIVSGITPSGDGTLHIGNYLGAVKQFIQIAKSNECFLFVADMHGLTTIQDKKHLATNIENLILNELALLKGFLSKEEFDRLVFYRQSDIGLHGELQSIINNVTPLGLLKRAHAYKDKLQKDVAEDDINLGLFNYPILMAADILMYHPDFVPVGKDQKQHVEITRDIAERFNRTYKKKIFTLPEPMIPEDVGAVLGTDGKRKMSKSLGNIISIFESEDVLRKQVNSTYTDPTRKHATDPGHIEGNMVFTYLGFFGEPKKVDALKKAYVAGKVSDVEVKDYLFKSLMTYFAPARKAYEELKNSPELVRGILQRGYTAAMSKADKTMGDVREAVGLTTKYSVGGHKHAKVADSGQARLAGAEAKRARMTISIDEFAKMEVRVGKVLEARNKEGSEKLIRLVVDIAEETPRIIFTGVRGFGYTPEDFNGKQFFFITNLAPRKMLDEESQGMILAVDSADTSKPLFISGDGMPVGAKIR